MKHLLFLSFVAVLGCGSEAAPSAAPVDPTPPPVSTVAPSIPDEVPEAPVAPEAPAAIAVVDPAPLPALAEVDLLHAVPARISVSSAYRDDATQVARIADGDLTTAWNSRSGDLVGSWIELEVPAEASVRAIAMTVGFTRTTDRSDLFVGNHRVSRVRVSRNDEVLGEHDLDTSSRELVEIPVNGPGGVLRIEVLATIPGTHADWRELCVSEIRVLGSAAGARAGSLVPTTAVGGNAETPTEDDEDAELLALDEEEESVNAFDSCSSLLGEWDSYTVRLHRPYGSDIPSLRERDRADQEDQRTRHQALFTQAATLFADASPADANDATRRAGVTDSLWSRRSDDFEALLRGCAAVMAAHPSQACEWAELRAYARLQELVAISFQMQLDLQSNVENRESAEGLPLRGGALEAEREALATATEFEAWLERIDAADWDEVRHRQRATLLSGDVPPGRVETEWTLLRTEVESAETACASGD